VEKDHGGGFSADNAPWLKDFIEEVCRDFIHCAGKKVKQSPENILDADPNHHHRDRRHKERGNLSKRARAGNTHDLIMNSEKWKTSHTINKLTKREAIDIQYP